MEEMGWSVFWQMTHLALFESQRRPASSMQPMNFLRKHHSNSYLHVANNKLIEATYPIHSWSLEEALHVMLSSPCTYLPFWRYEVMKIGGISRHIFCHMSLFSSITQVTFTFSESAWNWGDILAKKHKLFRPILRKLHFCQKNCPNHKSVKL